MATSRRVFNIYATEFSPYDMDGPVQKDIGLFNLSWNKKTGKGCYVMRMHPGSQTIPHTHRFMEEYLILEGELIESDGIVLRKGDLVSYPPGTHHHSRTETGCLLIAVDWDPR